MDKELKNGYAKNGYAKNGCKNIRYILNKYWKTWRRHEIFKREYKLERIASTDETEKVEAVKCANAWKGAFTSQ